MFVSSNFGSDSVVEPWNCGSEDFADGHQARRTIYTSYILRLSRPVDPASIDAYTSMGLDAKYANPIGSDLAPSTERPFPLGRKPGAKNKYCSALPATVWISHCHAKAVNTSVKVVEPSRIRSVDRFQFFTLPTYTRS